MNDKNLKVNNRFPYMNQKSNHMQQLISWLFGY